MKKILLLVLVILALSQGSICLAQLYYIGPGDTLCFDSDTLHFDSLLAQSDSTVTLYQSGEISFTKLKSLGKIGGISNIALLYNSFNASKPKKGQYEKTETFIKRSNFFRSKYKKKHIVDIEIEKKYNADDDKIVLKLRDFNNYLNAKHYSQYLGSSVGQNAFGVKCKIKSYKDTYYNINISEYYDPSIDEKYDIERVSNGIPSMFSALTIEGIKPKTAKKIFSALGIAYELSNIVETITINESEDATIDKPTETLRTDNILYSKICALYLYNKVTKDVYSKINFR